MAYTEEQARELVIKAGHRLLEAGLIARTWGNISARISDTQFVITPSGLAYENLQPAQLVKVNIADCGYEGTQKPSSEKGIHADAYRLRPGVNFVIHTHQENASIAGVAGTDITGFSNEILGRRVPCAAYGLSSTKKLRRAVTAAAAGNPTGPAVLMRHHGALCMGESYENAFAVASALEAVCGEKVGPLPRGASAGTDWGCSVRQGEAFSLTLDGQTRLYKPADPLTGAAAIHGAIYRKLPVTHILYEADAAVVSVAALGQTRRPLLDDLAQIAGVSIRCAKAEPEAVCKALKGRNAAFVWGGGALCTGATRADAEAARILLRKDCAAQLFAARTPGCRPVGAMDARLERLIYTMKYSKKKQA